MSFANLKKQSKLGSLTAKLVKEVEKMNNNGATGDDRLWKLDVDKSGNGCRHVEIENTLRIAHDLLSWGVEQRCGQSH